MKAYAYGVKGVVSVSIVSIVLCGLLFWCQLSCRRTPSASKTTTTSGAPVAPLPPDLTACKRVEIRFSPSTLEFICISPEGKSLLNAEETKYLETAAPFVVNDPEAIKALAEDVASSTYDGPIPGITGIQYQIHWACYDETERGTFFTTIGNVAEIRNIIESDGHRFKNSGIRLRGLVPQIGPFQLRVTCARNLRELHKGLREYPDNEKSYPLPSQWCGALIDAYRVRGYSSSVAILTKALKCPGASQGESHYAMNPECGPGSGRDTVLLFETKAGWNQHGGAELFTFDNHNPKGGLVLLNDGTVKFIRTEEELKQLRWK